MASNPAIEPKTKEGRQQQALAGAIAMTTLIPRRIKRKAPEVLTDINCTAAVNNVKVRFVKKS